MMLVIDKAQSNGCESRGTRTEAKGEHSLRAGVGWLEVCLSNQHRILLCL